MMKKTVKRIGTVAVAATAATMIMTAPAYADEMNDPETVYEANEMEVVDTSDMQYEADNNAEEETVCDQEIQAEVDYQYTEDVEPDHEEPEAPGDAEVTEQASEESEASADAEAEEQSEGEPETPADAEAEEQSEGEPETPADVEAEEQSEEESDDQAIGDAEQGMTAEEAVLENLREAETAEEAAREKNKAAVQELNDAGEEVNMQEKKTEEARDELAQAEQDLADAVSGIQETTRAEADAAQAELGAAENESDQACRECDAASEVYQEAVDTMRQAEENLELARDEAGDMVDQLAEKREAVDQAASRKTTAETALHEAVTAEKAAVSDVSEADAAVSKANEDYEAAVTAGQEADTLANAARTAAENASAAEHALMAEADQVIAECEAEYEKAREALSAAEKKAKEAKAAAGASDAKAARGTIGFFEESGSTGAVEALTECTYKSYIQEDDTSDAIDLENARKVFDYIRKCNELRARHGACELRVTDNLMAYAQANADYSDTIVAHSKQFFCGENVAWNNGATDPFAQWYDKEKKIYDSGMDGQTGHYLNIINPDYRVTGFGICTRRTMNGWVTFSQTFYYETTEQSWTVDEYEDRFLAYYNSVMGAKKAAEDAEAELNAASAAAEAARENVWRTQNDYEERLIKAADETDLKREEALAREKEAEDAAVAVKLFNDILNESRKAYEEAVLNAEKSSLAREAAEAQLTEADQKAQLAEAELTAAEESCRKLTEAEAALAEAERVVAETQAVRDAAEEKFGKAEDKVREKAAKLADLCNRHILASALTPEDLVSNGTDEEDFLFLNELADDVRWRRELLADAESDLAAATEKLNTARIAQKEAEKEHILSLANLAGAQADYDAYMASMEQDSDKPTDDDGADDGHSDTAEGNIPGFDVPWSDVPGSDVPGSDVPGSDVPGSVIPESNAPTTDSSAAGTSGSVRLEKTERRHGGSDDVSTADKVGSGGQKSDRAITSRGAGRTTGAKTGDNGPMPFAAMLLGSLAAIESLLRSRRRE